ncbi:hypothetical protein P175DRAFT_0527889 [Aspergillus ochraceoroseus IBT 24754]|uniref:Uncharacterized protein n=1 Tax=Aspergillus ochraceoroseus IBT 24754 TaxID=1392256 RepID=A0A2T5M7A2_9EURO|nr:uncharacterized protein P175DRAFT_0527889 [Aspergillus ochraceoroseus IBT 24754]PTU24419.1 hypothetical protein P175DRAFT_0527889 [Aspergillus ochraceoroseus IBT 24754]
MPVTSTGSPAAPAQETFAWLVVSAVLSLMEGTRRVSVAHAISTGSSSKIGGHSNRYHGQSRIMSASILSSPSMSFGSLTRSIRHRSATQPCYLLMWPPISTRTSGKRSTHGQQACHHQGERRAIPQPQALDPFSPPLRDSSIQFHGHLGLPNPLLRLLSSPLEKIRSPAYRDPIYATYLRVSDIPCLLPRMTKK